VSEGLATAHRSTQAKLAKVKLSIFGHSVEAPTSKVNYPSNRTTSLHYDFAYGRSDVEIFPFEMWRRMLLGHARKAPVRELDYGPTAGSLALREAIAVHLRRSRAVACDASQVIVVSGSQQALDLIVRVLIDRGDRVAIEDSIYQGTSEILRTAGAHLLPVPVDGAGAHVVLWPSKGISESVVIERAATWGVGVYGISGYFLTRPSRSGLMLGYSRMKKEEIRGGIRRLGGIL
jgi:GntR family transcriptional regulator / MocR family aminotransferase